MDLLEVKTVKHCLDIVTTDAYDEEVTSSWENCLDEVFQNTDADLAGQSVKVIAFRGSSDVIMAECSWKKRKLRVSIDSLDFKNLSSKQKLWLRAYLQWQGKGWGVYV